MAPRPSKLNQTGPLGGQGEVAPPVPNPPREVADISMLPLETQTLYAELVEHLRGADFVRSFADLTGGFTLRQRNDGRYWYFRTSEGIGPAVQDLFIGPDDASTQALMDAYRHGRGAAESNIARITRLAAMLRNGGIARTDSGSLKIIRGFANAGVFRMGGVLIGTHAFVAIGNTLGVRWPSAMQTQDVDFGSFANSPIGIGIPQTPQTLADVPKAIDALEMGFVPSVRLHSDSKPTTYIVPGKELRIDLVTSPQGPDREAPVAIPRLGAYAQPLEFMDYLLQKTTDSAIVGNTAVLVRIPEPSRYAVHKLLVASNRDSRFAVKAEKDRHQAAYLMAHLEAERPGDLALAVEEALARGPSWKRKLISQERRMPFRIQELQDALRAT